MSQMLLSKPKDRVLYSELRFERPRIQLKSSATEAACHVCNMTLREGVGLSARKIDGKTVLVCGSHLP